MKIAVLYHSAGGNTAKVAGAVVEAVESFGGIEAKAMPVDGADGAFIAESSAVIFGCPTYCGTVSWQLKRFLDTTPDALSGKLGAAFATEDYLGGGADFAELTVLGCLLVRGMIVYSGGAAQKPYTHFGAVSIKAGDELQLERVRVFALKIARKAVELFGEGR